MAFKTRITEMFGVETQILMSGMTGVGYGELVAAVAEAGALGFITAHMFPSGATLKEEIDKVRSLTSKPFGVNLTLLPSINQTSYDEYRDAIIESGLKIVETAGREPTEHLPAFKEAGVKVVHKCTSVRQSQSAVRKGVDIISIDGLACAGHPGEDEAGLIVLLPATVDALPDVPIVASGAVADGRSLVAALALGADGVNIGTRFCATQEARIHPNVKQAIVEKTELDTVLVGRNLRNTTRVARNAVSGNAVSERVAEIQRDPTTAFKDVRDLISGARARVAVDQQRDVHGRIWSSGQNQALIYDSPTCEELVANIIAQAHATRSRLERSAGYRIAPKLRSPSLVRKTGVQPYADKIGGSRSA